MAGAPTIFAILPAYREAVVIGQVIASLRPFVPRIVVVDDGSNDDTGAVARQQGAIVLRHAVNRGQGAALRTGIAYALAAGADVLVTCDADDQHDAADLPALLEPVLSGRCDVTLGSRFLARECHMPTSRRWLLRLAVLFTRIHAGLPLTDAHNGLRAFSRHAAERIRITQDRMAHASEVVSEIRRCGLRYLEVPVNVRYTAYSRSKGQTALGALRVAFDLWIGRGVH
jgi:polyprenyl-phospho-N-acetylgalactosaminyl synthase